MSPIAAVRSIPDGHYNSTGGTYKIITCNLHTTGHIEKTLCTMLPNSDFVICKFS